MERVRVGVALTTEFCLGERTPDAAEIIHVPAELTLMTTGNPLP